MEIDFLKEQLGNLLELHRDDDANEDDIVFATVDYMKKAHDVAKMLLLEGRFQELQRCLHLCQAAFGNSTTVRASVVGRSGSYAPLISFGGSLSTTDNVADGSEDRLLDQRTPTALANHSGEGITTGDDHLERGTPSLRQQQQQVQRYPFFVLHSDEDRRVFSALQSRTAQLQKQLDAAMRVRHGRDTEYYMQRLGLREKGATPLKVEDETVKVHMQQLPAFQHDSTNNRVHAESMMMISSSSQAAGGAATASILPAAPPRSRRPSRQASVATPHHRGPLFHVPSTSTASTAVPGMPAALVVPATTMQPQLLMSATTPSDLTAPTPPERGLSFDNQLPFGRGKGRIELPPLVTSGRIFDVAHDNPMSVQHTVFGSSAARAAAAVAGVCNGVGGRPTSEEEDGPENDFGIRAVEAVFGVQGVLDEVPLHLRPVPENTRLWSSSSASSGDSTPASSYVFDNATTSLQAEKAPSLPPLPPEPTLIDDPPLVSHVSPIAEEDDVDEDGTFVSPRTARVQSVHPATMKSSMLLSSTMQSVPSLLRRGAATGSSAATPAAISSNDWTLWNVAHQRRRNAPESATSFTRHIPPSWQQLASTRKRSNDSCGMSGTSNSLTASTSRTPVSIAENSSTMTAATPTTSASMSTSGTDQHGLTAGLGQNASPAAVEAAKAVEAARLTTQYVLSSIKAQHTRSDQALQRCDALTISRMPHSVRHTILAARSAASVSHKDESGDVEDESAFSSGPAAVVAAAAPHTSTPSGLPSSVFSALHDASPFTPHAYGVDWTLSSQLLSPSTLSHAASSVPNSPAAYAALSSPLQSTVEESGTPATTTITTPTIATAVAAPPALVLSGLQHALSPAAEQQLCEVRAAYEQRLAAAADDVRGLEARWVSQHQQLRTHASVPPLPPLEHIAEWRRRRGRLQHQPQHHHGHKDGNREKQRYGQSRHRWRGPPPLPPPVKKVPTNHSPTSAIPLPSTVSRGSDPSVVMHSPSRSPSLISTAATRESRLSSYNPEEYSRPSLTTSSSDAPQRSSPEGLRLEPNTGMPLLVTPVDRQSLPFIGLHRSSGDSNDHIPSANATQQPLQQQHLLPFSLGGSSPQVPSLLLLSTPQRIQPGFDNLHELPPLPTATMSAASSRGSAAWSQGMPGKPIFRLSKEEPLGLPPSDRRDDDHRNSSEEGEEEDEGRDDVASTGHNAASPHARTPSLDNELRGALADTGIYAHCVDELMKSTEDSSLERRSDEDEMATAAAHALYTFHPAVDAIIRERQQRREGHSNSFPTMSRSSTVDETRALWQRTLVMAAGDAKAPSKDEQNFWPLLRTRHEGGSQEPPIHNRNTRNSALSTWRSTTGSLMQRVGTEAFSAPPSSSSSSFIPPPLQQHQQSMVTSLDAAPLHRHGIFCGAAHIRARRTQEILLSAIREASLHVRGEDLLPPTGGVSMTAPGGSSNSNSSAATPAAVPPPPTTLFGPAASTLPRSMRSPLFLDFPDMFISGTVLPRADEATGEEGWSHGCADLAACGLRRCQRSIAAAGAATARTPEMSSTSVPSAATTTSTPAVLSITAEVLTPLLHPHDSGRGNTARTSCSTSTSKDAKRFLSPSKADGAPLSSFSAPPEQSTSVNTPNTDAAATGNATHNAYERLHAAYRVCAVIRAAPDWTAVAPVVLNRCLPLCMASIQVQRWWRQRLATRELQRRQRRSKAHVTLQEIRDAAALRIQRRVRVHWARRVMAQIRTACAAATEQRVAAEISASSPSGRPATGSSSYLAYVETLSGASGAPPSSTTSSRPSHRTPHRVFSSFAGGDDFSRASFGDAPMCVTSAAAAAAAATLAGTRLSSSQLSAPLLSMSLPTSPKQGVARGSSRRHHRVLNILTVASSSGASIVDNDTQPLMLSPKDPLAATARQPLNHGEYPIVYPHLAASVRSAPSSISSYVQLGQYSTTTAVEVPPAITGSDVTSSPRLSFLPTSVGNTNSAEGVTVSSHAAGAAMGKRQQHQQQPLQGASATSAVAVPSKGASTQPRGAQDPSSAARRIQRWYRRCSAKEAAKLRREVEVLAAVVTRRAPLSALREVLRNPGVQRRHTHSSDGGGGEGDNSSAQDTTASGGISSSSNCSALWGGVSSGSGGDPTADSAAMRALLDRCTGDVYEAYRHRADAARQRGDYKVPLERVSLRALQRIRQDREDEAKQQRQLRERQQCQRQEQQQRRERKLVDAAKLLQRVGRGLRWRRWLRERQCRELHYRATHTLDFLSQTDILGAHVVVDYRRSLASRSTTSAEEQQVYLTGGPKVTAHVLARLRETHPEWFGADVNKESAGWVVCNATPAQAAAVVTIQSFVAVFASRAVVFAQYRNACARSIQLVWRARQQRRRRRSRQLCLVEGKSGESTTSQ
jgi:hypothetical protein